VASNEACQDIGFRHCIEGGSRSPHLRTGNELPETHILLVEDDCYISEPLASFLRDKGYAVHVAADARAADAILMRGEIDLALLDVMLPGEDGFELCRRIRENGGPRVIMLTALSEPTDKVTGLELGADDYVSKPFDLRELLARIRAVLRRPQANPVGARSSTELVMQFSDFTFYPYRRMLKSSAGLRVLLTGAETDLLLVFCQNPRQVLSRETLISLTRGKNFPIAERSVDLLISRLRRKLAGGNRLDNPICTVRADGYAFQLDVTVV
jgi:two-component system, OmpR family, response regulator